MKDKLDRIFSIFIRLSYADHAGYVECFTCGIRIPWREAECGHWIRRQHTAVRFDENNCRPQCHICNCVKDGMEEAFEERLRDDLGNEVVDKLIEYGRMEGHFTEKEYKDKIHKYTLKVKEMGITI